jgi:hypothetical protein
MSGLHGDRRRVSRRRRYAAVAAALLVVIAAAIWFLRPSPSTPDVAEPPVEVTAAPSSTPRSGVCASAATDPFAPTKLSVPGVFGNAPVLALPRDARGAVSIPPVTEAGKREVAWDRPPGAKPGASTGNVLLNVHTWPDGTALGNQLLKGLDKGGRIVVRNADAVLCYRVTKRVEVPTGTLIPALYKPGGPPQLVIIACSGKRLGPANWTKRTLWYAVPESRSATQP